MKTIITILTALVIFLAILLVGSNRLIKDREEKLASQEAAITALTQSLQVQTNIDECIDLQYENYKKEWIAFCKVNKIKITKNDCKIPSIIANEFEKNYQKEKEMCITRYK